MLRQGLIAIFTLGFDFVELLADRGEGVAQGQSRASTAASRCARASTFERAESFAGEGKKTLAALGGAPAKPIMEVLNRD